MWTSGHTAKELFSLSLSHTHNIQIKWCFNKCEMFNIAHQLFFASEVSVTEQQTNSWRYNQPLCRTPSWHNTTQRTVHTAHSLTFLSDNTPTQKLTQFPVHLIWIKLLNCATMCSLKTTTTTLIVYGLLTVKLREEKPIYRTFKAVPLQVWSGPEDSRK